MIVQLGLQCNGRSTTGALVSGVNDWHTHLDNGWGVIICVVFFGLMKPLKVFHKLIFSRYLL